MLFIIVHGREDCDLDASEIIYDRLDQKGLSAEILTDEEYLQNHRSNGYFLISVGGDKVNQVSSRIKEIYSRTLDVSRVEMMKNFHWCWGSRSGVKSNCYHLNCGCLALWGPEEIHTLQTAEDFVKDGALFDDILKHYNSWTQKRLVGSI